MHAVTKPNQQLDQPRQGLPCSLAGAGLGINGMHPLPAQTRPYLLPTTTIIRALNHECGPNWWPKILI